MAATPPVRINRKGAAGLHSLEVFLERPTTIDIVVTVVYKPQRGKVGCFALAIYLKKLHSHLQQLSILSQLGVG